jgi:hypothetical protein
MPAIREMFTRHLGLKSWPWSWPLCSVHGRGPGAGRGGDERSPGVGQFPPPTRSSPTRFRRDQRPAEGFRHPDPAGRQPQLRFSAWTCPGPPWVPMNSRWPTVIWTCLAAWRSHASHQFHHRGAGPGHHQDRSLLPSFRVSGHRFIIIDEIDLDPVKSRSGGRNISWPDSAACGPNRSM